MARREKNDHSAIFASGKEDDCLDSFQLSRLEQAFRYWAADSPRSDVRLSRSRILLIFLIIRYTASKLSEVLTLNPFTDIDRHRFVVCYGDKLKEGTIAREVHISQVLSDEIQEILENLPQNQKDNKILGVDPGFVRRKFYERALACGYPKRAGGPEMIRKARAVEMLKNNIPLSAVQVMLGHSTPNLTSSYVTFSSEEIQLIAKRFMERESSRKTSARNLFHAKIRKIEEGDIQSRITLATIDGSTIHTVITNDSLHRLGLQQEMLVSAEVKAPLILLQLAEHRPSCSADNILPGMLRHKNEGRINTECIVKVSDTTEICAIVSSSEQWLKTLRRDDNVWVMFNSYSVVINV
ncbi:MAG: TOBE domain-containing protein [Desulfopila sp.]